MRKFFRLIMLVALLSFLALDCAALTLSREAGADQPIALAGHLDMLIDPTGKLGIDDVAQGSARAGFQSTAANVHAQFTDATIWVRFSLDRTQEAPEQWFLEVHPPWLDELMLFTPDREGRFSIVRMGDHSPFNLRPVQSSMPTFQVTVDTTAREYFIRFRTHGPATLQLKLWSATGLAHSNLQTTIFFSVLAGAVGVMMLMNLVFWFWIRDTLYLLYAFFLLSLLTLVFFIYGYGSSLLFPDQPIWADRSSDVSLSVFLMMTSLFSERLFEYSRHSVTGSRFLLGTALVFFLSIPFAILGKFSTVVALIIHLGIACAVFQTVFVAWLVFGRRQFQYLVSGCVLGFTNLIWGCFGIAATGYFNSPTLDFFVETQFPASLVTSLALLNVTVAARSRRAEKSLKLEQARALESALVAKRAMEEKVRQREFVSMVSHEFRTPLAIIDTVAHALTVSPAGTVSPVRDSMAKIRKAVHRLSMLVENILLDDRIDRHPTQRPPIRFDLRDIVGTTEGLALPGEEGRLKIELPPKALMVEGHRAHLEIALRNLVQNAFKYSPPHSPVTVLVHSDSTMVYVDISNTGSPIPESDKKKLFEKYFRGERSSGRIPGSGLGLYIGRVITRQSGGNVYLHTNGPRITFRMELPLSDVHDTAPPLGQGASSSS